MCVVASLDTTTFGTLYPQFASVSTPVLNALFAQAQVYLDNSECSVVRDCSLRSLLYVMLVAHLVQLGGYANTLQPVGPSGIVGRITDASEGTVRVAADWPGATAPAAWYLQTPYGASYWEATKPFRTMHYRAARSHPAPPQPLFGPFPRRGGW